MRIAVTGGMGFIGTELVSLLQENGDEVIVVDFWDKLLREYEGKRFPILDRIYGNLSKADDVMRPDEFLSWLDSYCPDSIVHLGAVVDTTDMCSPSMVDMNVEFTRELVRVSNKGRLPSYIPGIVFASSAAIYGSDFLKPNNPYGLTKAFGERIVASTRGQFSCLRFFNVFGPLEHHKGHMASLPFKISEAYRKGDRFDIHSLNASRDFIAVDEVAAKVVEVIGWMKRSLDNETAPERSFYDVGTGESTNLVDIDNFIMQATGHYSSILRVVPIPESSVGRYQAFTQAGMARVPVLGRSRTGTREGIERHYGRR